MRLRLIIVSVVFMVAAGRAYADPIITVGNYVLAPNEAGQTIKLSVTGGDIVTGVNLRAQLGDGLGPNPEPVFQSIGFGGDIWDAFPTSASGGPVGGAEQYAQASVVFSGTGKSVAASGDFVTLTIDTTGLSSGTYALQLAGTDIGADTAFIGIGGGDIPATITNGTITISTTPEPGSIALLGMGGVLMLFRRRGRRKQAEVATMVTTRLLNAEICV